MKIKWTYCKGDEFNGKRVVDRRWNFGWQVRQATDEVLFRCVSLFSRELLKWESRESRVLAHRRVSAAFDGFWKPYAITTAEKNYAWQQVEAAARGASVGAHSKVEYPKLLVARGFSGEPAVFDGDVVIAEHPVPPFHKIRLEDLVILEDSGRFIVKRAVKRLGDDAISLRGDNQDFIWHDALTRDNYRGRVLEVRQPHGAKREVTW